jgi:hypothetical protein
MKPVLFFELLDNKYYFLNTISNKYELLREMLSIQAVAVDEPCPPDSWNGSTCWNPGT